MRREKLPTYSPTTSISSHIPHSLFFFSPRVFCVTWVALPLIYTAAMSRVVCEHSPRRCVDTQMWRECRKTWAAIRWAVRRHRSAELPQPLHHTPKVKRAPKEVAKVKTHHPPQLSSLLSSEEKPRSENQWQQRWKNFDFVELCPSKHLAESVRNYLRFHKTFCEL